jgi:hypothetical protein
LSGNIERVKEIHRVATAYNHKLTMVPTEFLGEVLEKLEDQLTDDEWKELMT